jgi:hypothetical protein
MITQKEKVAFTELLYILNNVETEYYEKIPKELIKLFEDNSIKYYQYYDKNGQLKISELTEIILCYLNLKYWSDSIEKNKLIKHYLENEQKLKDKYDIYKSFHKIDNKN